MAPPMQNMFHPNSLSQPIPASAQMVLEPRPPHRLPDDYRSNGLSTFPNGDGALPLPAGPPPPQQVQMPNGGLRQRAATSGALFDGPRSPPSTKSEALA